MRTRVDARRDWRHAVDVAEETRNQYAFRVQRLPLLPRTRINAMVVNWPIANIRNLLDHFLTTVATCVAVGRNVEPDFTTCSTGFVSHMLDAQSQALPRLERALGRRLLLEHLPRELLLECGAQLAPTQTATS